MNNTFADEGTDDPDGNVGVGIIIVDHVDDEVTPVVENDEVVRNTITGFETEFEDRGMHRRSGRSSPDPCTITPVRFREVRHPGSARIAVMIPNIPVEAFRSESSDRDTISRGSWFHRQLCFS